MTVTKGKRKKEKVITLRMNNDSFDIIEEYAGAHGLSVNAFINSIIERNVEWIIPSSSYEQVTVPKKMLASLFDSANENALEQMAQYWATEARNAILLFGNNLTLTSAIDYVRRVSKYFIRSDAKISIIKNKYVVNLSEDINVESKYKMIGDDDNNIADSDILIVIRHDLGKNFSIFWSKQMLAFFNAIQSRKVSVSHDTTTVCIKIEKLR